MRKFIVPVATALLLMGCRSSPSRDAAEPVESTSTTTVRRDVQPADSEPALERPASSQNSGKSTDSKPGAVAAQSTRLSIEGSGGVLRLGESSKAARAAFPKPEGASGRALSVMAAAELEGWGWELGDSHSFEAGLDSGRVIAALETVSDPTGRLGAAWVKAAMTAHGEPDSSAENRHGAMRVWSVRGDTLGVFTVRLPRLGVTSTRVVGQSEAVLKLGLSLDDPSAFVAGLEQVAALTAQLTPEQLRELAEQSSQ